MISFTETQENNFTPESIPAPPEDPALNTILELENKHPARQWLTILLGLLALITVGGLIPFWLWVYFKLN